MQVLSLTYYPHNCHWDNPILLGVYTLYGERTPLMIIHEGQPHPALWGGG
jgi:hypothetical protein